MALNPRAKLSPPSPGLSTEIPPRFSLAPHFGIQIGWSGYAFGPSENMANHGFLIPPPDLLQDRIFLPSRSTILYFCFVKVPRQNKPHTTLLCPQAAYRTALPACPCRPGRASNAGPPSPCLALPPPARPYTCPPRRPPCRDRRLRLVTPGRPQHHTTHSTSSAFFKNRTRARQCVMAKHSGSVTSCPHASAPSPEWIFASGEKRRGLLFTRRTLSSCGRPFASQRPSSEKALYSPAASPPPRRRRGAVACSPPFSRATMMPWFSG